MKFRNDRQPQYGAGIGQHEANTFTWIGRIHRHECRAGFGHRQHRDNRFDRPRQTQRHTAFRTDTAVDQDSGQLRGTLVEVAIGQFVFEKRESHAVGVCACRTVEQLGQGARRSAKVTADGPHRGSLVVGQDVDVADDYCRICCDGFQDARESQTEAAYRLGVEQVGGKCERHRDSGRCIRLVEGFDSRHSEIEAADVGRVLVSAGDQLERHLYNRRIRSYVLHCKRLHHLLEPYLSVRLRITVDLDDAAQERRERRLQIDATPDGNDVRVGSRRRTDYHVRRTGQSAHHKREACVQDRACVRPEITCHFCNPRVSVGGDHDLNLSTVQRLRCRPSSIEGKLQQFGRPGELKSPIFELPDFALSSLALPGSRAVNFCEFGTGISRDQLFQQADKIPVVLA
ncbi:hypothetical protein BKP42_67750 [Rhodococcus erythropolis]|nr:hypothetical protein BKP42_67750 [Rhodococcus erythropolis]